MVAFTRDCEHAFAVRFLTYAAARSQVMFGIGHFTGETQNNWVRDHPSITDVLANYTWAVFKQFLTDDQNHSFFRGFDLESQYRDIKMRAHETVPQLISHFTINKIT